MTTPTRSTRQEQPLPTPPGGPPLAPAPTWLRAWVALAVVVAALALIALAVLLLA